MIILPRLVLGLACVFAAAESSLRAQVVSPSLNEARAAEFEAFLAALPTWNTSVAVKASYGYKDNLLLSFAAEESSPFLRGSVEVLLMRVPRDQFDFSFFADCAGTRYIADKTVEDDAKIWLRTEPAYRVGETLRFALPVTGYYYDQVFDMSDTEVERVVAELKVSGLMVGPALRWDFHPSWWVEAQGVAQRKRYKDGAYDGDIGEGTMRLGWARGGWFEASVSGARRWRDFNSRTQYSAAGRELTGTELKIVERETELRFDITWDDAERWETVTRFSVLNYRDNGSGYFNYREQRVAHDLAWTTDTWQLRIGGSASRVDFDVQTVGLGIDPPPRLRDEFAGEFHVGRKLNSRWTVFASYTWERWRSNDPVASYIMNEGLLGLRWYWEK